MTQFKVRFMLTGNLYLCALFAAKRRGSGYELLGNFTCNLKELQDAQTAMPGVVFEERPLP